jgi:hypothetical protein
MEDVARAVQLSSSPHCASLASVFDRLKRPAESSRRASFVLAALALRVDGLMEYARPHQTAQLKKATGALMRLRGNHQASV